jgi:hypothetical protein
MPLYICRWQNGDFSAVSAASKADAIELLDEVGNADVCELFTVKNFMVHFHLKLGTLSKSRSGVAAAAGIVGIASRVAHPVGELLDGQINLMASLRVCDDLIHRLSHAQ